MNGLIGRHRSDSDLAAKNAVTALQNALWTIAIVYVRSDPPLSYYVVRANG